MPKNFHILYGCGRVARICDLVDGILACGPSRLIGTDASYWGAPVLWRATVRDAHGYQDFRQGPG